MQRIAQLKIIRYCLMLTLSIASASCYADPGTGQIATLYAAQGNNFGFRVYLAGGNTVCSATNSQFGYTNISDDNYKVYVSTLTLAYSLGKPVTIVSEPLGGFCHIIEVILRQ